MSTAHIPYTEPNYLFPPRPKTKIRPQKLDKYEGGDYVLQPKLDGSCAVIFTNGVDVIVKSRHRRSFSRFKMDLREIKNVHRAVGTRLSHYIYKKFKKNDEKKNIL